MRIVLFMLVGVAGLVACGKNTEPPPPSSGSPMAQPESGPSAKTAPPSALATARGIPEEAVRTFETVCATCHGPGGMGDGPAAANLTPKPRNYTDAAWQASVTDDGLRTIILKGGQAVGKSAMMPGSPQFRDKPEVIDGLVQIIRNFGKQ